MNAPVLCPTVDCRLSAIGVWPFPVMTGVHTGAIWFSRLHD